MKKSGIKITHAVIGAGFIVLALYGFINPLQCQAFDASINISPNIINLESTDHEFGIHTDVPYSIANIETIILVCPEDAVLYPLFCYADSRGYLAAKFYTADLENDCELVINGYNTFVLEGETKAVDQSIEQFSGAADVLIIEKQAALQKGNGPFGLQNRNSQEK